jgi:hypothetical protein
LSSLFVTLSGCASMYGGENLRDDTITSEISASLGMSPNDLTLVSRRSEGVNTYVNVKTRAGKEMVCRLMGGGVMTFGLRTAPACNDMASGKVESSGTCNELLRAAGQCGNAGPARGVAPAAAPQVAASNSPASGASTVPANPAAAAAAPASATAAASVEAFRMDRARIAKAQVRLRELGFDAGTADGATGARTVQAVRQFQAAKNLPVTGTFDAATVRELGI